MPPQNHPIRQAVVLAGGLGLRLLPLTKSIAKPMVEVNGRPFLSYLLEQLRDQGIEQVLLLLGYLPETIQDYYGDGADLGVKIDYSVSPVEDETGRRLKRVSRVLDRHFLLLYCDNYWPFNLEHMWRNSARLQTAAQVVVYRNLDNMTRDNVRVDPDGLVRVYDRSRASPGLRGVDIGFALVERSIIEAFPEENLSFEATAYPELARRGQLGAFLTDHRYYSVGSLERLPATAAFLERRPTVLLDRDGVLNKRMGKAEYVCDWNDWEWIPGAREALERLRRAHYRVIVATNQPGIAQRKLSSQALEDIHARMRAEAADSGGMIDAVYHCPHGWDDGCDCRKPAPGLLFRAQHDFALDLTRSVYIGDDDRDRQAAAAAGCPFIMVSEGRPLSTAVNELVTRS